MLCAIVVVWGASRLSNGITRPLSDMMEQMERIVPPLIATRV